MCKTVLAFCLGVTVVIALAGCGAYKQPSGKQQIALPTGTLQQPVGEPAITPTSRDIPAFTKEDVIKYIRTHDMLFSDTSPSAITGIEVTFITSKEVNKIINRQGTGIPDNYLLCFARLTGTFTFPGPPTIKGQPTSSTYEEAYEVFDAKTGNLLMGGALGEAVGTIG
ncbi:MAG TPA: hypothetical protein VEL31_02615 [Ktedonobacteraceae bacterium]|nr:hypothetical protein [Ktedonobacteraceae bacterium]